MDSPVGFRLYSRMDSPIPSRHTKRMITTIKTTPTSGAHVVTPVLHVSRSANRNLTPVHRVTQTPSRNVTPVYRMTSAQAKCRTTPKSIKRVMCTPVSHISSPFTPARRVPTSAKLLKSSCKRLSQTRASPAMLDDSVFSPCAPVISSPCNKQFLIVQEQQLRQSWKLSIGESPRAKLTDNTSTPQRTQDAITVKKLLGSGGFGSVYVGTYKSQPVAVKYMRKQSKNCSAMFENFLAELRVMSLCHENILKTLAASDPHVYDTEAFLIMEYIDGRNLQQLIDDKDVPFSLERRVKYGQQISAALDYCHSNNIVHLDIKPANILVSNVDQCKIADFGCCQFLEADERAYYSALTGTYAYRAPELLRGERPTVKADIYALGMTLWQMSSREKPYTQQDQHVVIFAVVAYNLRPPSPTECTYSELYRRCWDAQPDARPSASYVSEHLMRMIEPADNPQITIDSPDSCIPIESADSHGIDSTGIEGVKS